MRSTNALIHPAILLFLPLALGLGMFVDSMGFKLMAFAGLSLGSYAIFMVPIRWSLVILLTYIGFEGFLKIVSNYHPVVHVGSDLLVIALCLKVLLQTFFKSFDLRDYPPVTKLILVHFSWLVIVMFNPYALSIFSSIAGAKIYVSMILLYFFGYYITESGKDIRIFMLTSVTVTVIHTIFGLYQGYYGPESVLAIHPRYGVQLAKYQNFAFRPFGLTNLPGGPSIFLYSCVPFFLYFIYYLRSFFLKLAVISYIPFGITLLLLCQVRSAIFKAIFGGALFMMGAIQVASKVSARVTQGLILVSTGILLVMIYLVPQFVNYSIAVQASNEAAIERSLSLFEYESVSVARKDSWPRFVRYVSEVPLGAGFARTGAAAGAFKQLQKDDPYFGFKYFFTDNFWITTLVEIGLPGMIIMTLILLAILYRGAKDFFRIKDVDLRLLHLALFCGVSSIFIGLYGAEGVLYNPDSSFFWFFSGVMMKIAVIDRKKRADEEAGHKNPDSSDPLVPKYD